MVDFKLGPSETEIDGCVIAISLTVYNEGELSIEDLEDIDSEMSKLGSGPTGQRIRVNQRPDMETSSVVYVYQHGFQISTEDQVKYWFQRMRMKTRFDEMYFNIGTEVVEFREVDE